MRLDERRPVKAEHIAGIEKSSIDRGVFQRRQIKQDGGREREAEVLMARDQRDP